MHNYNSRFVGIVPLGIQSSDLAVSIAKCGVLPILELVSKVESSFEVGSRLLPLTDPLFAIRELLATLGTQFGIYLSSRNEVPIQSLKKVEGLIDEPFEVVVIDALVYGPKNPSNDLEQLINAAKGVSKNVFVEIHSIYEARQVEKFDISGFILKGAESGGVVGDTSSFILLQQCLTEFSSYPLWVRGGIGLNTASGAIAIGAQKCVLDTHFMLTNGVSNHLGFDAIQAFETTDGSETKVIDSQRIYVRPGTFANSLNEDFTGVQGLLSVRDLKSGVLEMGQDACFAKYFKDNFVTVEAIVEAFEMSLETSIKAVKDIQPLKANSPLARSLNVKYPIAQGPMTRVSDTADFALEVANGGALPFIALSLLNGEESLKLLKETKELLNDKPFGVGILGFVPPELREKQLSAVSQVKPNVALVAGGRPTQASNLEAIGISTFLHVPSPGLLLNFLKDGARKFVFEGRECGGHVGPRSSFVLYQQQINVLKDFAKAGGTDGKGSLDGVEIFFAGGIHDSKSAALVATCAVELSEMKAKIGVLVGTAYLFTSEAVSSGAILGTYQQEALDCSKTSLLETSPGHATRCVESEYVKFFKDEKEKLVLSGKEPNEVWQELETLNLGRLRIASKGIARNNTELVSVDEVFQKSEGMYMIGDVATMRDGIVTISELHYDISENSAKIIEKLSDALEFSRLNIYEKEVKADPMDIAIVGMAGVFPGASSPDDLWANVLGKVDSIEEVSNKRWDSSIYYEEEYSGDRAGEKVPSKWGGFLDFIPFDALKYGIPPSSLEAIEPVQLLALEVANRALCDAGYEKRVFNREKAAVIFGAEAGTDLATAYSVRSWLPGLFKGNPPKDLEKFLPKMTEDSFAGILANVIAGRIANRLDLRGINCTVDAACASSLAALDLACKELISKDSDLVICGGADLHNGIHEYFLFGSVHALSRSGRSKAFDKDADGITLGEAVGAIVLKRLKDAKRDGDKVYAVIEGIAGSSDGRHLGLTAPRKEGQKLAIERAVRRSGVAIKDIGLVEAHGTGTIVGDRTELSTLVEMFKDNNAVNSTCTLGSVKSNIGHTKCAAGIVGVIKASLAIYHGVRPPTLHLKNPHSVYSYSDSPFRFEDVSVPWVQENRAAGVSSFGFGGANFHAVLRNNQISKTKFGMNKFPCELFLLKGETFQDAIKSQEVFISYLRSLNSEGIVVSFGDIAFSHYVNGLSVGVEKDKIQAVVIASSTDNLLEELEKLVSLSTQEIETVNFAQKINLGNNRVIAKLNEQVYISISNSKANSLDNEPSTNSDTSTSNTSTANTSTANTSTANIKSISANSERGLDEREEKVSRKPKVAFIFPGQGSQRPRMLSDLFITFKNLDKYLKLGSEYLDVLFPPRAFSEEDVSDQKRQITDTQNAQPLLGIVEMAACDLLESFNIRPSAAAGHSYGELVALWLARCYDAEELLFLSEMRSKAIADSAPEDPGTMAAVKGNADLVTEILNDENFNNVQIANFNSKSQTVISGPTQFVKEAVEKMKARGLSASLINVSYGFHSKVLKDAPNLFKNAVEKININLPAIPVWSNKTASKYEGNVTELTDLLTSQVGESVRWSELVESMYDDDIRIFVEVGPARVLTGLVDEILREKDHIAIALDIPSQSGVKSLLALLGQLSLVGVDVKLDTLFRDRCKKIDISSQQPKSRWVINGHLVKYSNGNVLEGALKPMNEVPSINISNSVGEDRLLSEYLSTMKEMVRAERDVMLAYFGVESVGNAVYEGEAVPILARETSPKPLNVTNREDISDALPELGLEELLKTIVKIVSDRTGYPIDMLSPDQDLEADLSIDSIKRIEILGEFSEKVGLTSDSDDIDDAVIEELAQVKTMKGIVEWIIDKRAADNGENASFPNENVGEKQVSGSGIELRARTFEVNKVAISNTPTDKEKRNCILFEDKVVGIIGVDKGVLKGLEDYCVERGARSVIVNDALTLDSDVVIDLRGINSNLSCSQLFCDIKDALNSNVKRFIYVNDIVKSELDDVDYMNNVIGFKGLIKTVNREASNFRTQLLQVTRDDSDEQLDEVIKRGLEVIGENEYISVDNEAYIDSVDEVEISDEFENVLTSEKVAVIIGGARGFAAKVAKTLHDRFKLKLILVGRTNLNESLEDEFIEIENSSDIRKLLISKGETDLKVIEERVRIIVKESELIRNLRQFGDDVEYINCDVSMRGSLNSLLSELSDKFGQIDLIINAAGVLEDKYIKDKTLASFTRVYETKVNSTLDIVQFATNSNVKPIVVLFGSVSGVFGNIGQVDYAAANDSMDSIAKYYSKDFPIISLDFGPLAGGGMVTNELATEYEKREIGLLEPTEATKIILNQINSISKNERSQLIVVKVDSIQSLQSPKSAKSVVQ